MIITRLYIDNLYGFQDFELDLTYPRKQPQSLLDYEYLEDVPKFKFKRVCILMGTNASGKTSLGKVLWRIQHAINHADTSISLSANFYDAICNKEAVTQITMEFVIPKASTFHYINIKFKQNQIIDFQSSKINLKQNDTNYTAQTRLKKQINEDSLFFNFDNELFSSFYYAFAENHNNDITIGKNLKSENLNNLLCILQTFDSSITDVRPLQTEKKDGETIFEGYTVFFENGDSVKVTDDGETFTKKGKNRFSKGTYDILSVADFILSIIRSSNTSKSFTYFLDEKLASSHSELEIAILNLIIQKLNKYSQFFYTTHNYDVLDLNLPAHSFAFLHKELGYCSVEHPEKLGFSKNDRKLKGYVRNNYFRTVPSTHLLDDLMWSE